MKKALVLPAYNEAAYIGELVKKAREYVDHVIVVNDNSKDETAKIAKAQGAIVLNHCINLHKAAALKTGAQAAIALGSDILIFMDSDGQHRPEDLPRFIEPLESGKFDIVIGARQGGDRMPLFRYVGNRGLEMAVRLLFGITIKDIQSGYRAFRTDKYKQLEWTSNGYHADAEMTVRTGRYGLKYKQVPIDTIYHDDYKGMGMTDGFKLLIRIFMWRVSL